MHGFSPVDGFMDVKEGVDEMIQYVANEPSVGLFFVQQHAYTSMPYLLNIKDKVVEKIHEVTLHTEDTEDSICVVRSMTECGLPMADDMIKDINKSLLIMSTSQPKKGLIRNPSWGFSVGRSSSNPPVAFNYGDGGIVQQDGRSSRSYLSAVFSSAKQKAAGLRWTQRNPLPESHNGGCSVPSSLSLPESIEGRQLVLFVIPSQSAEIGTIPNFIDVEGDELPLSRHDDSLDEQRMVSGSSEAHDVSPVLENYEKLRSDYEARLEEWLQETENHSRHIKASNN